MSLGVSIDILQIGKPRLKVVIYLNYTDAQQQDRGSKLGV